MNFVSIYITVAVLIGVLDLLVAVFSFTKKDETGRYLGITCIGATMVDASYTFSVLTSNHTAIAVSSSIYFISIDLMLNALLIYIICFTRHKKSGRAMKVVNACFMYMIFEVVVFAINPFFNIAVGFPHRDTIIACYRYDSHALWYMHLAYTYLIVIIVIVILVQKMLSVAREYAIQYLLAVAGIVTIVAINAVFLYLPDMGIVSLLDISILGYGAVIIFLYWCTFYYFRKGMMSNLKNTIFENIDKGIVLFDYDDRMTLINQKAKSLLSAVEISNNMDMNEFLSRCGIEISPEKDRDAFSMQCYVGDSEDAPAPLRCDYRYIGNSSGKKTLGRLFVFSDAVMDTDLLTGFLNWDSFCNFAENNQDNFSGYVSVAVCDITGLSITNATYGRNKGDKKIRELADLVRNVFPFDAFFVRGQDANLIVICRSIDENAVSGCLERVKDKFAGNIVYSIGTSENGREPILKVIEKTRMGMKTRKLLDKESIHSSVLNSLLSALKESDADTEAHVKRTQNMSERLALRLGLSEIQRADLSLICIMHDIGKIGIPLEILNKPGKLSAEEWKIMQSHVEKSYQIALSSEEFVGIADAVRHHHERWDGKGYPLGLSRESIPLLSRIIAVIDAYDAMISERTYQKAMPKEMALEELKKNAGKQFDPTVVAEFIRMIEQSNDIDFSKADKTGGNSQEKNLGFSYMAYPEENTEESKSKSDDDIIDLSDEISHPMVFSKYILDEQNRIIEIDDFFESITGYSREDVFELQLTQMGLLPERGRMEYFIKTNELLGQRHSAFIEHMIECKDGSSKYVLCYGRQYYDSAAKAARSEIIISDSSNSFTAKMIAREEQKRAEARLDQWEQTYRRDSLTGLLNHAAFLNDVELKLLSAKYRIVFIMIDVDNFKAFNDSYGHRAGDEFLVLVANSLDSVLRTDDQACRMGGDEFAAALYFDNNVSEDVINSRVIKIFDALNILISSVPKKTSVSMGVCISDDRLDTFNKLYDAADKALYNSKFNGRAKVSVYNEEEYKDMSS